MMSDTIRTVFPLIMRDVEHYKGMLTHKQINKIRSAALDLGLVLHELDNPYFQELPSSDKRQAQAMSITTGIFWPAMSVTIHSSPDGASLVMTPPSARKIAAQLIAHAKEIEDCYIDPQKGQRHGFNPQGQ